MSFTTSNFWDLALLLILILQDHMVVAPPAAMLCDKELFGTPNPADCVEAIRWIPYFGLPIERNPATAIRTFVEPQFLDPPFSPVKNDFRLGKYALVQLPKIWSHSMHFDSEIPQV